MLKRKAESQGGGGGTEATVDPVPRPLPQKSITLHFYSLTWEEVAPGQLYYLPLCQTPKYMMNPAHINQFNKFKPLWETMQIHAPKYKISNMVMLQDDLRVQNNTPTDATAFTQVIYMLKYCPAGQKQYFKLGNAVKQDMSQITDLSYKLQPIKSDENPTQLITITGYENFENLTIQGAKANYAAGFVPGKLPSIASDEDYRLLEPYIAPNSTSLLSAFSANYTPSGEHYIPPTKAATLARNQGSINTYKYGDVIEGSINTNLDGVHLLNTLSNDFLSEQTISFNEKGKKYTYEGEFVWPSRNRPYFSRGNYFDSATNPITQGKKLAHLEHCFLTMPPIRKPNGALLGQRCSFMLEQSFDITFHMAEGTYMDTEEDNALQVHQDNAVVTRRIAYPVPDQTDIGKSVLCKDGNSNCLNNYMSNIYNAKLPCYEDSFDGIMNFFLANPDLWHDVNDPKYVSFQKLDQPPTNSYEMPSAQRRILRLNEMDIDAQYPKLKDYWNGRMQLDGILHFYWDPNKKPGQHEKEWIYMSINDNETTGLIRQSTDVPFPNYVSFNFAKYLEDNFYPRSSNRCSTGKKAVQNKVCQAFFV